MEKWKIYGKVLKWKSLGPIKSQFYDRFYKREFLNDPLTNLISRLAYIAGNIGIERGQDGVYCISVAINENEYARFTTTDELLQAKDGKCFGIEESIDASLFDISEVIDKIMKMKRQEKDQEIQTVKNLETERIGSTEAR